MYRMKANAVALGGVLMVAGLSTVSYAAPSCLGKAATIVGTAGKDKLKGTAKADVIVALAGNDSIKGLGGNDRVCGGDGNDVAHGGPGDDRLDGGGGSDKAAFLASAAGVTASLTDGTATGEGTDVLTAIEGLQGSAHDDTLIGSDDGNGLSSGGGHDTIEGRGGNDVQKSGPGNDTILGGEGIDSHYGGLGDDEMDGGPGQDAAAFKFSPVGVKASFTNGKATGEGNDSFTNMEILVGSRHDDELRGDDGDNAFYPLEGNDDVDGGEGSDQVLYVQATGGVVVDLATGMVSGADGNDTLAGIETVIGSQHNDSLSGDDGFNYLVGVGGNDTLDGRGDFDALDGGNGTDSCLNGEDNIRCE